MCSPGRRLRAAPPPAPVWRRLPAVPAGWTGHACWHPDRLRRQDEGFATQREQQRFAHDVGDGFAGLAGHGIADALALGLVAGAVQFQQLVGFDQALQVRQLQGGERAVPCAGWSAPAVRHRSWRPGPRPASSAGQRGRPGRAPPWHRPVRPRSSGVRDRPRPARRAGTRAIGRAAAGCPGRKYRCGRSQATPRRSRMPTSARPRLLYLETPAVRWRGLTGTLVVFQPARCISAGRYRCMWSKYGRSRNALRSNSLMPQPVSGVSRCAGPCLSACRPASGCAAGR